MKLRFLLTLNSFSSFALIALSANAAPYPYPIVGHREAEDKVCFMHTQQGYSLDLTPVCGEVALASEEGDDGAAGLDSDSNSSVSGNSPALPNFAPATGTSIRSRGSAGGSNSAGRCDYPDQIAADGKRCGDRAASRKPGGRLGGTPLPGSTGTGSSGSGYGVPRSGPVRVRPYVRNGRVVQGHTRSAPKASGFGRSRSGGASS